MAGREYELLTKGGDGYISEVTAWTFMPNLWIDAPVHQPIAWMFGRIPVLEPLMVYAGAGLGLSTTDLDTTDNVSQGRNQQFLFGVRVNFYSIPYPEKWAIRRDAR